jgi:aconitate hydratase
MASEGKSLRTDLVVAGRRYAYVSLQRELPDIALATLPRSLKILFENVARNSPDDLPAINSWWENRKGEHEIPFFPNRVLMHDTTCVPALADFAAMRDAVAQLGGDPRRINPRIPVHLVIDHSVMVDYYGTADAIDLNLAADFQRNSERYRFVKWAEKSLSNFKVVPPGTGILHQVNIELLAEVVNVVERPGERPLAHPDTLVGTDSHTPMVNALGVLAWGVGGIEGQAAMVGQPIAIQIPEVVGVKLKGALQAGVTATDLVLSITELLRRRGVIGKYLEFCGPGVAALSLADRATVSNMAPEYGATCALFPIDNVTLTYLRMSGRRADHIDLIESYARAQGLWCDESTPDPRFDDMLVVKLGAIEPCVAGPRHPHDRKSLARVSETFMEELPTLAPKGAPTTLRTFDKPGSEYALTDGAVVIAAITSCTNTSNPALIIGAGLLARNAHRLGLTRKPWVKTSLSPGSKVVSDYLDASNLQDDLDALGFNVVGYGCMTCIGNSGALEAAVISAVEEHGLCAVGVLSGNRNFDGRVNSHLVGAYLASPALVVAYAIAGRITCDLTTEAIGIARDGAPVYLRDIWPAEAEIDEIMSQHLRPHIFTERYRDVWAGTSHWQELSAPGGLQFQWDPDSDYIRRPPYFERLSLDAPPAIAPRNARPLLMVGDNITTDHISPAGTIPSSSLAGKYLSSRGVLVRDFNQYSTRRSNHEVMLRGAFSNPKLYNELLGDDRGRKGGLALTEDGTQMLPVYEAALTYGQLGIPLVILAGKNYGAGSSRDWAAKAPALLGVRAVVAESFERIHRSNLIGMGVLPLLFGEGLKRTDLCRDGHESLSFEGLGELKVGMNQLRVEIRHPKRADRTFTLWCQLDSQRELSYLRHGGILPFVVRGALV